VNGPSRLTQLVTVRHSTTAHNAAQIISGRLDEPLSEEGRELARDVALRMPPLPSGVVVSSPMKRAVETAVILTGCAQSQLVLDDLCVERDYGLLQGLRREEVQRYADQVDYVEVGGIRHSLNPPRGESFEALRRRAELFLDRLSKRGDAVVIVVSHQTFLQQLHGLMVGLDITEALGSDIRTLQIDRFEIDDGLPARHDLLFAGAGIVKSW
jgi:broad specificity phosphatase PhoE